MSPELRHKIDFCVGSALGFFGALSGRAPFQAAAGYILTDFTIRRHDAKKIAILRDVLLNPDSTDLMARIFHPKTAPSIRQVALAHLFTRIPQVVDTALEKPQR